MEVRINITPMSLGCGNGKSKGILGLPSEAFSGWDAMSSVPGKFVYAGITSDITFTPKHTTLSSTTLQYTAKAWQFTINNSVQFSQLMQDGVYTYATEKKCGEQLVCDLERAADGLVTLTVTRVEKHEATPELDKLAQLLKQGIRPEAESDSGKKAPVWNAPSAWIDFSEIQQYSSVRDCIYLWTGSSSADDTVYLYVGIVGDTRSSGQSKRSLATRLQEEQKKFGQERGVSIRKFRYCALNNANGMDIPNLLKTIEMAEITVLSSLFFCADARDNITPLFDNQKVVLLNKSTSFKFIQ